MKSAIIPGLLKCNTEAAGAMEGFGEGCGPLECPGPHDHSAIGMPRGVAFPKTFLTQTAAPGSKRCVHCPLGYVSRTRRTPRLAYHIFPVNISS